MKIFNQISKTFLILILICFIVLGNFNPIIASNNTKTMTVTIGEGEVDQSNLSKVVTIPNLKEIVKILVNNGNISHVISGDKVTINASEGKPSRTVENPKKYSKEVKEKATNDKNEFNATKPYEDSDMYKGELSKNGSSRVISGTYIPEEIVEIEDMYVVSGFRGDIYTGGGSAPGYWDYVDDSERTHYSYTGRGEYAGFSGRLSLRWEEGRSVDERDRVGTILYGYGTGKITKPAIDTRIWEQSYSGTVYKSGIDNYYKYKVTIEYIDNSNPELQISTPSENSYFGKNKAINISGTAKDEDKGDILSIKYTINGIPSHTNKTLQTITADGKNQSFSKIIAIDNSIPQGIYTLKVWTEDNKGGKSSEVLRTIKVDKTSPTMKIIVGK